MKRRLAIAGLGAAAMQIHLPAYAGLPELEIVGGCDPVTRGRLPFARFDTVDELLHETAPDILAVVAPTSQHRELARKGLLAGCHVLCEKPFMASMDEADEIVGLSREKGRWVVVNNQYRFMNIHARAKQLVGTPEFGELLFVNATQTFQVSRNTEAGWRGLDPRRTCQEFGIHALDLCRFFFGEDPVCLHARMPKGSNPDGPDFLNLIRLEFSGDRVAHLGFDRLSRGPHRYLDMRLDGSEGCIETSIGGHFGIRAGIRGGSRTPYVDVDITPGGSAVLYSGARTRRIATAPFNVFAHGTRELMRAFLCALDAGTTPPCHAEDNRRTLALVFAAYESHERRREIAPDY